MGKIATRWHGRGHHSFTKPLRIVEKEASDIEGTGRIKRERIVNCYKEMQCEHCDETHLKYWKTITNEWSYR